MTIVRLGLLGWLTGLFTYLAALAIVYGEWISRGDLGAVAFGSFVAFALCYWLVYLPVLRTVRRLLPPAAGHWVYPAVAILLGLLPTAMIARFQGGSLRALVTPEGLLFLILFTAVGIVVGLGFTRLDPVA
jgi:hypothetical protein